MLDWPKPDVSTRYHRPLGAIPGATGDVGGESLIFSRFFRLLNQAATRAIDNLDDSDARSRGVWPEEAFGTFDNSFLATTIARYVLH